LIDTSPCTGKQHKKLRKEKSASSENAGLSTRFVNEGKESPPASRKRLEAIGATLVLVAFQRFMRFETRPWWRHSLSRDLVGRTL
jgi:hypothetical protein